MDTAVERSRNSLLPWLPWAAPERKLEQTISLFRRFRGSFDRDEDYVYGIFDSANHELLGGTGLHKRVGEHGFEIGYWVDVAHQRKGIATETTTALIKTGFELFDIDRIEIKCDTRNAASIKVIEAVGLTREATLKRREQDAEGNLNDLFLFTMFRDEYEQSKLKHFDLRWFGPADERLKP
jgi:RimJ/RimL family protein N-acetyltransferase